MPGDYCKHEILRVTCADCRPRRPVTLGPFGPWTPAQYEGVCAAPACGQRITVGDDIRHADGVDGWVCASCGST